MRKIFIDSNVQAIAEEYRDEVLKHLHYGPQNILVNPLKKLKRFKKYFLIRILEFIQMMMK